MHRITVRAALVGTASLASLVLGAAAYAAVGLPGAASDHARTATAAAGVTVPGPNEHAGDHPSTRGTSADDPATEVGDDATDETTDPATDPQDATDGQDRGKGSAVSQLATTTDLKGVEKGAAISTLASGGKSQAGQHGKGDHPTPQGPKTTHGKPPKPSDGGGDAPDAPQPSGSHAGG